LVYSWLRAGLGSYQITPSEFSEQPASYFLDAARVSSYFEELSGVFWVSEKRIGIDRVTLKYTRVESFETALIIYLQPDSGPHVRDHTISRET